MWLLEPNIKHLIEHAEANGLALPNAAGLMAPSCSVDISGGKARINVKGVLTKTPSVLAMIFGGGNTTYSEIISAIKKADADASVSETLLLIDSPGGHFDGMIDALDAVKNAEKPVTAVALGMATSAAYALGAQAKKFLAGSRASLAGSIGVASEFFVSDNRISIASTKAPKKRPDVQTEAGRAIVREELDALHDLFVDTIARGRGVTADKINSDFGQGATLLADEAIKRGMLDGYYDDEEEDGASAMTYASGPMAGATPPFKDYPLEDRAWDSTVAVRRWRERSGSTDAPSADYKNGFFWYDTSAPESFGSYKLPFVDIVNGRPAAIRRAIFAANAAMSGARGGVDIPAADRAKVQAHIDKYRKKTTKEAKSMTLEELRAQHPEAFSSAVKLGADQERDRVSAHLTMGEASGDMVMAIAAVQDGSPMTAALQAKYMAAGMKKNELTLRTIENPPAVPAVAGTPGATTTADQVAEFVVAALGHEEGRA